MIFAVVTKLFRIPEFFTPVILYQVKRIIMLIARILIDIGKDK